MIVEIFVDFASEFYYGFVWFYRIFGSFYFKYCTIFTWILSICISFNNKYFFSLSLLRHESNAFYVFTSFSIKYFSALQVYVALDIGVYLFIWLFNAEKRESLHHRIMATIFTCGLGMSEKSRERVAIAKTFSIMGNAMSRTFLVGNNDQKTR